MSLSDLNFRHFWKALKYNSSQTARKKTRASLLVACFLKRNINIPPPRLGSLQQYPRGLDIDLAQVIAALLIELGDLYLASSAGKLVLSTLSTVAEMERDLLVEQTNAGLARARAVGKKLGRLPETYATDFFSRQNAI